MIRRWRWVLIGLVLGAVLTVAALGTRPPANDREAVLAVAATVKCPTCVGESAAVSQAPVSIEMRLEIGRQLDAGIQPDAIRSYFAERYGEDVLLEPELAGTASLVWLLPVVALGAGGIVLVVVLRRWRRSGSLSATDDDRRLVAAALASFDGSDSDPNSSNSDPSVESSR